ncbi:MAG: ATP-grasp domain-containing protein [Clostridia bacterium]|nr:ATP-grasp domain-containing protein [Clostridia bacterium]
MLTDKLKGKRLLIIGGTGVENINIINAAHAMGVVCVVVDKNTDPKTTQAKQAADEAWDMDYSDIDALAKRCRKEKIDGVMAGYSEPRVLVAAKVSQVLGLPFYATPEQVELTRNKRTFKDYCMKYDIPIAQDFCFAEPPSEEERAKIKYPVIVKPTDYGGRKGITVCFNREQLDAAIDLALKFSFSGTIIIEEYLEGRELMAIYTLVDGKATLSCLNEKYIIKDSERLSGLCQLVVNPSKHYDEYIETMDGKIKNFLSGIDAKNGVAFFQLIATPNGIKVFEMGYRVNGNNDYKDIEKYNDISYMKMLISYSLTGSMGDDNGKDNPIFGEYLSTLVFYCHAGTVGEVDFGGIKEKEGVGDIYTELKPGRVFVEDGTTQQKAISIRLTAPSIEKIAELIDYVQANTKVLDKDGKNMLFTPFDTKRLFGEG